MRDEQFQRLYAEHAQSLFGFLSYRTGDRALAEDLLADTFQRARHRSGPPRDSEKTWLYAIALNVLGDQTRRHASERDLLSRSLAVLSERDREAIALRFGADLSVPEIARLTKEPHTTIDGRVYRALRKLREQIDAQTL